MGLRLRIVLARVCAAYLLNDAWRVALATGDRSRRLFQPRPLLTIHPHHGHRIASGTCRHS